MKTQKPIVILEDLEHSQQSWNYTKVVKVGDTRFRIRLRRNAYDFQSYAIVERWNGEEWKQVLSRPISEMLCKEIGYYEELLTAEQKGFFEFDADALLKIALEIVS